MLPSTDLNEVIGEIWINDKKAGEGLEIYFGETSISIRTAKRSLCPNINLRITPALFESILNQGLEAETFHSAIESGIGVISDHDGYAAADLGTYSREISNFDFKMTRQNHSSTKFEVIGKTGLIRPDSVYSLPKPDLEIKGSYQFRVWFIIFDSEIKRSFGAEDHQRLMPLYIKSHLKS